MGIVINLFGVVLSVISLGLTVWAVRNTISIQKELEMERDNNNSKIKIIINNKNSGEKTTLPFKLRRGDLTRSELFGYLRLIPKKVASSEFKIAYLSTPEFFSTLQEVKSSRLTQELIINCEPEEYKQFDFENFEVSNK